MSEIELSPGVKILRRAVIIMGFVLVFCMIAFFVAVFYKLSHKKPATSNAYAKTETTQSPACDFKPTSNIEINGNIISSSLSGNILTIITSEKTKPGEINENKADLADSAAKATKPAGEIIIYDLCKGEALSRINLVN